MTLIWVYNATGKLVQRCGRQCRIGCKPEGRCVCGDICRGKCLAHALDEVCGDLRAIKKHVRKKWGKFAMVAINAEVWQPSLPFPELQQEASNP